MTGRGVVTVLLVILIALVIWAFFGAPIGAARGILYRPIGVVIAFVAGMLVGYRVLPGVVYRR